MVRERILRSKKERVIMLVVNLFGAPGAGKSTGAAYIFSQLKLRGVNAELVTEFAKDMVWAQNKTAFEDQVYIMGNQSYRMSRLRDKVDVVVTDSPILLGAYYNGDESIHPEIKALAGKLFNSYDNFNVFIERAKPYNESGRLQTEEESDAISMDLMSFLREYGVEPRHYKGEASGYMDMLNDILERMGLS